MPVTSSGRTIKVTKDLRTECLRLGVNSDEIIKHYNEYVIVGMRGITFNDGALKAIYEHKKKKSGLL